MALMICCKTLSRRAVVSTALLTIVGPELGPGRAVLASVSEAKLGNIVSLAFSSDGRLLAAAADNRRISVWHLPDGQLLPAFAARPLQGTALKLSFLENGERLCVIEDGAVEIFGLAGNHADQSVSIQTTCADICARAGLAAYRSLSQIVVLDLRTLRPVHAIATGLGLPGSIAFSPDGRLIAAGAKETELVIGGEPGQGVPSHEIAVFDWSADKISRYKALSTWFSAAAFSLDGSRLASVSFDHLANSPVNDYRNTMLSVWSLGTPDPQLELPLRDNTTLYSTLSFVGNQNRILATGEGSAGGDVVIIDANTGRAEHAQADIPSLYAAAVNPAGTLLAAGGRLPGIRVLHLPELVEAGALPSSGNASKPITP